MLGEILIVAYKLLHFVGCVFWRAGFSVTDSVGQGFVLANVEPIQIGIGGVGFDDFMDLFDDIFT